MLYSPQGGFMGCRGMADPATTIVDGTLQGASENAKLPENWEDCVFRVHPPGQY